MILGVQPVERGAHVVDFSVAVIVLALAQSRAAKVEAQHGETKTVQRFHGVEDDFVVQRSAEQRVRMTDDRGVSRIFCAGIQQCFQPACGAVEKQRADG